MKLSIKDRMHQVKWGRRQVTMVFYKDDRGTESDGYTRIAQVDFDTYREGKKFFMEAAFDLENNEFLEMYKNDKKAKHNWLLSGQTTDSHRKIVLNGMLYISEVRYTRVITHSDKFKRTSLYNPDGTEYHRDIENKQDK